MDNLYTSPELFRALKTLGIGACGTVRVDRKGMPSQFRDKNLEKGQVNLPSFVGTYSAMER